MSHEELFPPSIQKKRAAATVSLCATAPVEVHGDELDARSRPRVPALSGPARVIFAFANVGLAAAFTSLDVPVLPIFFTFNAVMFLWSPVPHDYK